MLEQLVMALRAGGSFEVGTLAAQLGCSPALVQAMLEHLQRSGILRLYQTCGDGCGGCQMKSACHTPTQGGTLRLWHT